GYGTTGMFPVLHCRFVIPSRRIGSTIDHDRSGWWRATDVLTKSVIDASIRCRSTVVSRIEGGGGGGLGCDSKAAGGLVGPRSSFSPVGRSMTAAVIPPAMTHRADRTASRRLRRYESCPPRTSAFGC